MTIASDFMFDNEIIPTDYPTEESRKQKVELGKRIFSALIMAPIVFFIMARGGFIFYLFSLIIAGIALLELQLMFRKQNTLSSTILNYVALILICSMAITMIYLRSTNVKIIYFLLLNTIVADTSAYFIGKRFQGKKIAPKISPGKTYSGFTGSLLCSALLGFILSFFSKKFSMPHMMIFCLTLNLGGFLGDLFESKLKRICKVKDSGFIIPGHGGVLDRIDSLLFNTLLIAFYI